MIAASTSRIAVTHASHPVFADLTCEVHDDRVAGLIGPNGCGKTTLLRVFAGDVEPVEGVVSRRSGLSIGHLTQDVTLPQDFTIHDSVRAESVELAQIEQALARVEERLSDPAVYENEKALQQALAEQEELLESFDRLGGPGFEARVRSVLHALGFREDGFDQTIGTLSGGQQKLIALAAQAVRRPDLLLLDEPDNHLDLDGKRHLERFLREYDGGVVLVSHDRYLLDLVVDEILELEGGVLRRFPGNYSEYAIEKEQQRAQHEHRYADQQKEIRRLEQSAKRLRTWGVTFDNVKFIKRAQAIERRIERMEKIERPHVERRMDLRLKGWRGSTKVLEIGGLKKSYARADGEPNRVLRGLDLLVRHGERVGLIGPNGAGKSVLFRLILGEESPTDGSLVVGPSICLGYYAQQHETLDASLSLIDSLRHAAGIPESKAMQTLMRFAFTYDQARRPVADLSGGERSRLQLALIVHSSANFLLLDEPTNNLDIASAEILEDALESFEGSVLVISHDRYFLDRVVDRIVELTDGRLTNYVGGYSEYAARRGCLGAPQKGGHG
ncbi:MAG: ABC-F family ATP-binding cassette domain-containing protein [Candidatus Bipolaricaulia bacterium]